MSTQQGTTQSTTINSGNPFAIPYQQFGLQEAARLYGNGGSTPTNQNAANLTNDVMQNKWSSRLFAPPGLLTQKWMCVLPKGRWMI